MRILEVGHFPPSGSGSGVYAVNIGNSLVRAGHQVAIVFPENRAKHEEYEGIKMYPVFFKGQEEIPGVEQANMNFPCFTTHPRSVFNFKDMTPEQRAEYERIFRNKINQAIEEFRPDIVHGQHLWTLSGISAECCEQHGIPLVLTCHGTDLMGISREQKENESWGTNWARKAVDYADSIITISKDSNELAESILPNSKGKTVWIRNGVDSHVFYPDATLQRKEVLQRLGVQGDYSKIVSFVGKLTDFKGVDILLDAAAQYERDDIITLIAGDGELRQPLEEQRQRLGLKNIVFLGNLPQAVLREIYNVADCSTVPSRREPFGLVAAEAMLCGTPVIATNQGGLPDFVTPDVGILVDVEDATGLARAIQSILSGEKKFDRTFIASKIKESYSQDSLISRFVEAYDRAIAKKKSERDDDAR